MTNAGIFFKGLNMSKHSIATYGADLTVEYNLPSYTSYKGYLVKSNKYNYSLVTLTLTEAYRLIEHLYNTLSAGTNKELVDKHNRLVKRKIIKNIGHYAIALEEVKHKVTITYLEETDEFLLTLKEVSDIYIWKERKESNYKGKFNGVRLDVEDHPDYLVSPYTNQHWELLTRIYNCPIMTIDDIRKYCLELVKDIVNVTNVDYKHNSIVLSRDKWIVSVYGLIQLNTYDEVMQNQYPVFKLINPSLENGYTLIALKPLKIIPKPPAPLEGETYSQLQQTEWTFN